MASHTVPVEQLPEGHALVYAYASGADSRPHPMVLLAKDDGVFRFFDYNLRRERRTAQPVILECRGVLSERALRFMHGLESVNTALVLDRVLEGKPIYDFFIPADGGATSGR